MSINLEILNQDLLHDLLDETDGDEITNRIRRLIKQRFALEFIKLPLQVDDYQILHHDICNEMTQILLDSVTPFQIGGVIGSGKLLSQMVKELISQIRGGGNRFNMVTATEALVANMATEAANSAWIEFVEKIRKSGNLPVQITAKKNLKTIMREIEECASPSVNELDEFLSRLEPVEASVVGRQLWDRNYHNFCADIRSVYYQKTEQLERLTLWSMRIQTLIRETMIKIMQGIKKFYKFAKFAASLSILTFYWAFKSGITLGVSVMKGFVSGVLS